MSVESLWNFRLVVLDNPELQDRLRSAPDTESFFTTLVQAAGERGYVLTREDVSTSLLAARTSWLQRWACW